MSASIMPAVSVLFLAGYSVGYILDWPLFFYLPTRGEIEFGRPDPNAGPAMGWYGLLALGALSTLLAPLFRVAVLRMPQLCWLLPVGLMVYVLAHESHWFLR